ncbi:phosphatidylserine decarboxylase-domain-containing protein [Phaeosphaeriaceae sp. PMI808]|nr:phosphatidylserine decarboxylase-domain-containing protein [Phaeosphaeriaceae sp. PMI808]
MPGHGPRNQKPIWRHIKHTVVFNKLADWLDRRRSLSALVQEEGTLERFLNSSEQEKIATFIDYYGINMDDYDPDDPSTYSCFDAFLQREFKDGARCLDNKDSTKALICADSTISIFENVPSTTQVDIMGMKFCIATLVENVAVGMAFDDGTIACFHLGVQHCHRFFSPVSGRIDGFDRLPAIPIRRDCNETTIMAREGVVIESPDFGRVLFVILGANPENAQIFDQFEDPDVPISAGEEIGHFLYGDLSVIVAFQKNRIKIEDDLRGGSKTITRKVAQAGAILGHATKPAARKPKTSPPLVPDSEDELTEPRDSSNEAKDSKESFSDTLMTDAGVAVHEGINMGNDHSNG